MSAEHAEVSALPEWQHLSHAIEYDPTWPDGKPNLCIYCDEALAEGDEMCGHNAALMALIEASTRLAIDIQKAERRGEIRALRSCVDLYCDEDKALIRGWADTLAKKARA